MVEMTSVSSCDSLIRGRFSLSWKGRLGCSLAGHDVEILSAFPARCSLAEPASDGPHKHFDRMGLGRWSLCEKAGVALTEFTLIAKSDHDLPPVVAGRRAPEFTEARSKPLSLWRYGLPGRRALENR